MAASATKAPAIAPLALSVLLSVAVDIAAAGLPPFGEMLAAACSMYAKAITQPSVHAVLAEGDMLYTSHKRDSRVADCTIYKDYCSYVRFLRWTLLIFFW